jgi:hypothetical protein
MEVFQHLIKRDKFRKDNGFNHLIEIKTKSNGIELDANSRPCFR